MTNHEDNSSWEFSLYQAWKKKFVQEITSVTDRQFNASFAKHQECCERLSDLEKTVQEEMNHVQKLETELKTMKEECGSALADMNDKLKMLETSSLNVKAKKSRSFWDKMRSK